MQWSKGFQVTHESEDEKDTQLVLLSPSLSLSRALMPPCMGLSASRILCEQLREVLTFFFP